MYLYLKTHNKTGLKYLGKTKYDPHVYQGSGVHWLRHIKKHGYDVSTEILFETEDTEEFKKVATYISRVLNVVDSKEFANLIPESGDGGDTSKCIDYNKIAEKVSKQWKGVPKTEEHKRKIAEANTGKVFSDERKKNISDACKGRTAYNKGKTATKIECPHCKKIVGGENNFKRWHGDNCKELKDES